MLNGIQRRFRISHKDMAIAAISVAVLLTELLLTRIFSVTMFYHLSFMVVSLAMLGLGLGGLLVNLWPKTFCQDRLQTQGAWGAILFSLTTVLAIGVALRTPISLELSADNWMRIAVIYGLAVIPFTAAGFLVALLLSHNASHANRLYFFDLVGAGIGCLAFIPATNILGAPTAVLCGAAMATVAAFSLARREAPLARHAALVVGLGLLLAAVLNIRSGFFDVRFTKGEPQQPMLALRWNSFSRVEVVGSSEDLTMLKRPFAAGLSAALDPSYRTKEIILRYDAEASTQITAFDGRADQLVHLGYDVTSAPYQMRRYKNVLVIGAGGGRDVLTALHMGSGPVTAVEVNPLTVELVQQQFRNFSGGLYSSYDGVRIVNDEGRSFIRQNRARYDLIQASLVDTWAASAAGAYALTENNLYTVEAFQDYLTHLETNGVIAVSRWYTEPPVEFLRLITIVVQALKQQGVSDPRSHLVVVRTNPAETNLPSLGTLLVKPLPFGAQELSALGEWAKRMRFILSYVPDDADESASSDFHRLLAVGTQNFSVNYPYDISPVYDDRPFFFDRVPLIPWIAGRLGLVTGQGPRGPLTLGGQTLLVSLIVTAGCTLLLVLLPLLAGRWREGKVSIDAQGTPRAGRARGIMWAVYFVSLGLGFILVEIVLIQRFSLFLGYPVYSLCAVLLTLLLAGGLGSLFAGKWEMHNRLPQLVGGISLLLASYALLLPRLLNSGLVLAAPVRIALAVAVVAPIGFFMGMPFPTGIRKAALEEPGLVSWAWSVNGGASVLGSTLAVLISMTWGFTTTLAIGAASYGLALAVVALLTGKN